MSEQESGAVMSALADPFDPSEVKWKPQAVSGNRALAIAFVDARVVQDRLDEVLGVDGWQDEYEVLPDGCVTCRLRLRLGGEWIAKMDVGGQSEQPDEGDKVKAAFSDALKRTAVKFGIGRYLYRLPHQWVDYDAQKRKFVRTPTLPDFALPGKKKPVAKVLPRTDGGDTGKPVPASMPDRTTLPPKSPPSPAADLRDKTNLNDEALSKAGVISRGELANELLEYGKEEGFHVDVLQWAPEEVSKAKAHLTAWVNEKKKQKKARELSIVKGG